MQQRWKQRPPGSNWGDFGPDDELGRLNLVTPEVVRRALAEVRDGRTFCLSLPLDLPGGNVLNSRRHPPTLYSTVRNGRLNYNYEVSAEEPKCTDVICDDAALLFLQYSTQWDSFAHVGSRFDANGDGHAEPVYYNGWRGGEDIVNPVVDAIPPGARIVEGPRARRMGVETFAVAGCQSRGVLVDVRAHLGDERRLVGYDDLMRIMEADGCVIEAGDFVCLHTGFADVVLGMRGNPTEAVHRVCAVLDGRDERLLQWITDSNLAALIADNYAVEGYPARPGGGEQHAALPLHEHCLFKLGVHLGEMWYLTELAAHLRDQGRTRFLLTAPPLRLPGAVGSPVTPIATV